MNRRGFLAALIAAPVAAKLPWGAIASFIEPVAPALARDIRVSLYEIIAATLRKHGPSLAANIQKKNALYTRLMERQDRRGDGHDKR